MLSEFSIGPYLLLLQDDLYPLKSHIGVGEPGILFHIQ